MRDIYKAAEQVLVWLGPGDGRHERSAFSFLCDLASRECNDVSEDPRHVMAARPETKRWIELQTMSEANLQRWLDVADLLASPWFSRMWIIQEVVMGKTVIVARGRSVTI
jgi:hypothetical protein